MNKIYIGIPTKTGNIYFELAICLMQWSKQNDIQTMIVFEPFAAPIDHARNMIVHRFLGTDCTHLMMIDDDIVPPVNALEQLLTHDKDIVAAACPLIGPDSKRDLKITFNAFTVSEDETYTPIIDAIGLQEADAVGTGCIMIKRDVLENIESPFITQYNKNNGLKTTGEDINFCKKAKGLCIEIYSDFGLKCKHIKSCNLLALKL